jgi:hypothetical protein
MPDMNPRHIQLFGSGSGDIVVNPSLQSDRDRRRLLTALQGEVAGADQMTHLTVAYPNGQAPQPHAGPRAVRLHPLGARRPETGYIWWVIFRQRVSAGLRRPSFEVDWPIIRLG